MSTDRHHHRGVADLHLHRTWFAGIGNEYVEMANTPTVVPRCRIPVKADALARCQGVQAA